MRSRWLHALNLLLIVMVAAAFCAPIFLVPWWDNHDHDAYPVRLIEYVRILRFGNSFPRWAPDLYGGFGAPLFNYYAPGVFSLSAPFALLGCTPALALKIAVGLFTVAGGVGMYALAGHIVRRADAALVGAVAFMLMPYRATQLFTRGDLAEYGAISLVPLTVWIWLRLANESRARLAAFGFSAALLLAAVLLTHTLTGQWLAELIAVSGVAVAVRRWRRGERNRAAAIIIAGGGAALLSAIYTLPAWLERDLVHIERMTEGTLAVDKNFVEPERFIQSGFFFLGYPILAAIAVAAVWWFVAARRRAPLPPGIRLWIPTAILIEMTMSISQPLWSVLPLARYIQFPWRLLGFVAVTGAATVAGLFAALPLRARGARTVGALLVCAAMSLMAYTEFEEPVALGEASVPVTAEQVESKVYSTVISDEYLPRTATSAPRSPRTRVAQANNNIEFEWVHTSGSGYALRFAARSPAYVWLNHHFFPGWAVKLREGPAPVAIAPSQDGLIQLSVPGAGVYEVAVNFHLTPVRLLATVLSAMALLLLFPALWWVARMRLEP